VEYVKVNPRKSL